MQWNIEIDLPSIRRLSTADKTPGEDPTLNGEYAVAFVTGVQGNDTKYLKAAACLKHYASYSQETGREGFAAVATSQDMEDTYLPSSPD